MALASPTCQKTSLPRAPTSETRGLTVREWLLQRSSNVDVARILIADKLATSAHRNWPSQRGLPAPKTRTALLYRATSLDQPLAWGWDAVTQYADLPADQRHGFYLFESFKKYLMLNDFPGEAHSLLPCTLTHLSTAFWSYARAIFY